MKQSWKTLPKHASCRNCAVKNKCDIYINDGLGDCDGEEYKPLEIKFEDYRPFRDIKELLKIFDFCFSMPLLPLIWIQNRFTEEVELIVSYDYANSFHSDDRVETSTRVLTMDDLYGEYRFLNGDICGVKI